MECRLLLLYPCIDLNLYLNDLKKKNNRQRINTVQSAKRFIVMSLEGKQRVLITKNKVDHKFSSFVLYDLKFMMYEVFEA